MKALRSQAKSSGSPEINLAYVGYYSMFGLMAILFAISLIGGASYSDLIWNMGEFLSGNLSSVPMGQEEALMTVVPNIAAILFMMLALAITISAITNRNAKSFRSQDFDEVFKTGPLTPFLGVLLEEAIVRWFLLGLIAGSIGGALAFYVCFFVGNLGWALVHVVNYKATHERNVARVIPQFVVGIFLTYVFVRYGIFVTVLTHFLYNLVVMATRKKQMPNVASLWLIGYYLIVAMISWGVISSKINESTLSPWLNGQFIRLESFGFWEYAAFLIMLRSVSNLIEEILLLDVGSLSPKTSRMMFAPLSLALSIILYSGIVFFGNWLLAFVIDDPLNRVLVLAFLLSLNSLAKTGSAISRTLTHLPNFYFTVVVFIVLGFWQATVAAALVFLTGYLPVLTSLVFTNHDRWDMS